jgi:hypothetical protein
MVRVAQLQRRGRAIAKGKAEVLFVQRDHFVSILPVLANATSNDLHQMVDLTGKSMRTVLASAQTVFQSCSYNGEAEE